MILTGFIMCFFQPHKKWWTSRESMHKLCS